MLCRDFDGHKGTVSSQTAPDLEIHGQWTGLTYPCPPSWMASETHGKMHATFGQVFFAIFWKVFLFGQVLIILVVTVIVTITVVVIGCFHQRCVFVQPFDDPGSQSVVKFEVVRNGIRNVVTDLH